MEIALEILLIFLLLLANGLFALSEIAMVSSRSARLQTLADRGSKTASLALTLKQTPEKFLSTVQVGITLVGILAGAVGGAALAADLAAVLQPLPVVGPYALPVAFIAIVGCITYVSLVVGELVPKHLALRDPEWWACATAPMMNTLASASTPVVWLLSQSTGLVLAILRIESKEEAAITEDEVNVLVAQGASAGSFRDSERDIVARVLHLDEQPIRTAMTHRMDLVWLRKGDDLQTNLARMIEAGYSNFPLCDELPDNVIGVVSLKAVWKALHENEAAGHAGQIRLESLATKPVWIHETMMAADVLELFRSQRTHVALVQDEYGGLAGLVTDHDLLEAIVGYIPGADSAAEEAITVRADGSFLVAGWAPVTEAGKAIGLRSLKQEKRYHTMAGLLLHVAGRLPAVGDVFDFDDWTLEVVDKDGNRIDQILVSKKPPPKKPTAES